MTTTMMMVCMLCAMSHIWLTRVGASEDAAMPTGPSPCAAILKRDNEESNLESLAARLLFHGGREDEFKLALCMALDSFTHCRVLFRDVTAQQHETCTNTILQKAAEIEARAGAVIAAHRESSCANDNTQATVEPVTMLNCDKFVRGKDIMDYITKLKRVGGTVTDYHEAVCAVALEYGHLNSKMGHLYFKQDSLTKALVKCLAGDVEGVLEDLKTGRGWDDGFGRRILGYGDFDDEDEDDLDDEDEDEIEDPYDLKTAL
jgi:hypothetical protein